MLGALKGRCSGINFSEGDGDPSRRLRLQSLLAMTSCRLRLTLGKRSRVAWTTLTLIWRWLRKIPDNVPDITKKLMRLLRSMVMSGTFFPLSRITLGLRRLLTVLEITAKVALLPPLLTRILSFASPLLSGHLSFPSFRSTLRRLKQYGEMMYN